MRMGARRAGAVLAVMTVLGGAAVAPRADAQTIPACSTVLTNPIVLRIGATQEPHLKPLARGLRMSSESTAQAVQVAYLTSGTCTNVAAIYNGENLSGNVRYIPGPEMPGWDPSQPSPQCSIPVGTPLPLDVGNAAAFASACTNAPTKPADLGEFRVGEQAYLFVVPQGSSQTALTAEEGYFVFGFGNTGQVTPWNDESFFYILPSDRSTLITTMAALGVPLNKARGQRLAPLEVLNAVAQSATPEKTLGLAGTDLYDTQRERVKALAYKAFGQRFAYFADSTGTAVDKANVRNGLYGPWSPSSYFTKVGTDGRPANPRIDYLIRALSGGKLTPPATRASGGDFEPLDEIIKVGLVPDCAMKVMRSFEGGDLSNYESSEPCHCYYEAKVGTPNQCKTCTDDTTCGAGKCRHGYCEAR